MNYPNQKKAIFWPLTLMLCLFITYSRAQDISASRNDALTILRDFRDTVTQKAGTPAADSLSAIVIELINTTKTQKDLKQLQSIKIYFNKAMQNYSIASTREKMLVIHNLNLDLNLKSQFKPDTGLNIEGSESLFHDADVSVLVDIQGVRQSTGKYTVFWAEFTGIDQKKVISSGAFNGNSTNSKNPYKLTIQLPGYITFWIEDTTTSKKFRSNPDHLVFGDAKDRSIEVNFIPF